MSTKAERKTLSYALGQQPMLDALVEAGLGNFRLGVIADHILKLRILPTKKARKRKT